MLARASIAVAVLLAVHPVPTVAQTLDRDERDCQQAIATAARQFEAAKLDALVDCNVKTITGGACDTAKRDDKIARTADRLGNALDRGCRGVTLETLGFPGACADATGAPFSTSDLRTCVFDTVEAQVDQALAIEFPAVGPQPKDVAKCQATIGRRGERFLQGKLRARARCADARRARRPARARLRRPPSRHHPPPLHGSQEGA